MPQYGTYIPSSALLSGLNATRGGRRLRELRDKTMTAISLLHSKTEHMKIVGVSEALSVSVAVVPTLYGSHLMPNSDSGPKTIAQKIVWDDGMGNYTILYAMGPGVLGNGIQVTINAPDVGESLIDSDLATNVPKVEITPKIGDYAATLAAINTSRLIRAEQVGSGGVLAAVATSFLTGGLGTGPKLYLSDWLWWDYTQYGALFAGLNFKNYVSYFDDTMLKVQVMPMKLLEVLAPMSGVAGATLKFALEYDYPLCREEISVAVVA